MPAYNFQQQFAPQIETGAAEPKTLTFRRLRTKPPSRHANVGEIINLWTGQRTKSALRRGVGLVMLTALVRFSADGIELVSEFRTVTDMDPASAAIERELMDRQADAIARRDGFENWAGAWAWHTANRDEKEKDDRTLLRAAIVWLPLTREQIAAVESGARLDEVA